MLKHALYKMLPKITAVVAFMMVIFLNSVVPMITDAKAITTIPVPLLILAEPDCCPKILPDRAVKPFPIANPRTFIFPESLPKEVTNCGLLPDARSNKPDFVFKYKSMIIFTSITNTPAIISTL